MQGLSSKENGAMAKKTGQEVKDDRIKLLQFKWEFLRRNQYYRAFYSNYVELQLSSGSSEFKAKIGELGQSILKMFDLPFLQDPSSIESPYLQKAFRLKETISKEEVRQLWEDSSTGQRLREMKLEPVSIESPRTVPLFLSIDFSKPDKEIKQYVIQRVEKIIQEEIEKKKLAKGETRMHLEKLKQYIQVYDWREPPKGKRKLTFSEIAKKLNPDLPDIDNAIEAGEESYKEFEKLKNKYWLKMGLPEKEAENRAWKEIEKKYPNSQKTDQAVKSAIESARYYHKQALWWINEGYKHIK